MKKTSLISLVVILALLVLTIPAGAAGWTERISGGMSYATPYGAFTVTLSAWENADGTFGGQGQYYYPPIDRTFHLKVQKVCTGTVQAGPYTGQPYAIGIGEVFGQDGTEVSVGYGAIAVAEGDESGDGVRVWFDMTWDIVNAFCESGANNSFPAKVVDGNFNIRSK